MRLLQPPLRSFVHIGRRHINNLLQNNLRVRVEGDSILIGVIFLADPANSFANLAYLDSWETLVPKHSKLELVKMKNQPKAANNALATFVEKERLMKRTRKD